MNHNLKQYDINAIKLNQLFIHTLVYVICLQDHTQPGVLMNGVILQIFALFGTTAVWITIALFLHIFVTANGFVQGVDNFRRIPGVSNNTCIHKEFGSYFLFVGFDDYIILSFLDSIPIFSKCNIVNHVSTKYKLAGCCPQCCVISASHRPAVNWRK